MPVLAIPGLTVTPLATTAHQARIFGPRPGVPNVSANDPANLFVVDLTEHPLGVGAGFPEPPGLATNRRTSPFRRHSPALRPLRRLCLNRALSSFRRRIRAPRSTLAGLMRRRLST